MSGSRPALTPLVRTELRLHLRHRIVAGVVALTAIWIALLQVLPVPVRPTVVAWLLFLDVATIGFFVAPALLQVERAGGVTAALRLTRLSPHQALGVRVGCLVGWAVLAAVAVTVGAGIGWAPVVWVGAGLTACLLSVLAVVLVGRDETLTGYLPRVPAVGVALFGPALVYGIGLSDHPLLWLSPATGALELLFGRWSWVAVVSLVVGVAVLWSVAHRVVLDVRPRTLRSRGVRSRGSGSDPADLRRTGAVRSLAAVDRRTLLGDRMLVLLVLGIPLLAVLVRLATGPGLAWLEGRTGADLSAYLPLVWALVLVVHAPVMAGAITGMLFLEDRDAGVLPVLATTPAGLGTLVGYRLGVAAGSTVVAIAVSLPLAGAQHAAGALGMAVTAVAGGAVAAVPAALLASYGRDRVAGTALLKAIGLPLYLPLAWWFVDGPTGWLFAVVPTAWAARALWADTLGATLLFALGGVAVSAAWAGLVLRRFHRSIGA